MGVIEYITSKFKSKDDTLENKRLSLSKDEITIRTDLMDDYKLYREKGKTLMAEMDELRKINAELQSININLRVQVDILNEELGKVNSHQS